MKYSKLFKSLNDLRKYENVFRDAYDIYFYISGYDRALLLSETSDENEEWVYSFLVFIRERLHDMYEPKVFKLWYNHFGEMISMVEPDNKKGIELFYLLLDEFSRQK